MFSQLDSGAKFLLLEEGVEKHQLAHEHPPRWRRILWNSLQASFFIANIFMLVFNLVHRVPSEKECLAELSVYSPANEAALGVEEVYFNATFDATNLYKGTLSYELDEAWDNIAHVPHISISETDVRKLGKDPRIAVKFPEEDRDESRPYVGMVETFHQLHCLNLIRQYIHLDYYNTHSKYRKSGLEPKHIDHCIDILRQVLMCNADVAIVTLNWVTFMDHPTADFNTKHKCRNFDAVMNWTINRAADPSVLLRKKEGDIELDHYPVLSDHQT